MNAWMGYPILWMSTTARYPVRIPCCSKLRIRAALLPQQATCYASLNPSKGALTCLFASNPIPSVPFPSQATPIMEYSPCGPRRGKHPRMQLRDGAVQHASARGVLQHDGSGSIHWEAATLWPHADADRVFHPDCAARAGHRTAGGSVKGEQRIAVVRLSIF